MSYYTPTDLTEALEILASGPGKVIAGGTDVYPAARPGVSPPYFLDVTGIEALGGIDQSSNEIRIGAAVNWSRLIASDLPPAFDAMKAAAREVGSRQIQNAGTIAGNLCNASPAADGVPPLMALDAEVELISAARGSRRMPLSEFLIGVRKTALRPDELMTAIHVPQPPKSMTSAFEKLGSRRYLVISICMTAVLLDRDKDGRISEARVAVGACSPVAQRLTRLEADLLGRRSNEVEITPAHLSGLSPIDDVRGDGAYRLEAVAAQCLRAIKKAAVT